MATASPSSSSLPLGKYLASTDKKTRDKAIKNLAIFLSEPTEAAISKSDIDKLWKGIFYCFWMSDKPLVQQALAAELAEMLLTISSNSSALPFLRGFWETIVREWSGIDRLRIDKFYMMIRRFVNASFRLLMLAKWDKDICDQYNAILIREGGPLCPSDIRVPTSLSYHLADIYLEELDKTLNSAPSSEKGTLPVPLGLLLEPFLMLSAQTHSVATFKRVKTALLDPIISSLSPMPNGEEDQPPRKRVKMAESSPFHNLRENACLREPCSEGNLGDVVLKKRLLRIIFEIASRPDTRDSNRRKLYALWKEGRSTTDSDSEDD